ncbi:MAG: hypothetical protein A2Y56_03175 [Candidatus Aminicenantes bacterium RBG_13_63_10]|nr:MAG: hypothetical protein A2Y56_03175 [Candidatus Aminicenantes bacterium RBG_13_63_10]
MFKLCRKDFLACRWWWLLVLAVYGLNWMFAFRQSLGVMFLTLLLAGGCLAVTFYQDHLHKTEVLYGSLPLTRGRIVRGRYLLTGFLSAGALVVAFAYGSLLRSVFGIDDLRLSLSALGSMEGLTGYALAVAFLAALYFPLHYRLGAGKAVLAFFLSLLVLAVAVPGLGQLGLIPAPLARFVSSPGFLKDIGLGIIGMIGRVSLALGTPLFLAAAVGLASIVLAVSIRLATRFYEKTDL